MSYNIINCACSVYLFVSHVELYTHIYHVLHYDTVNSGLSVNGIWLTNQIYMFNILPID